MLRCLTGVLLVGLCCSVVQAQQQLAFDLKETPFVEVRHKARQVITVLGQTKDSTTTIRILFEIRPKGMENGKLVLDAVIRACDDSSTVVGAPAEESETLKGLRGAKFRIRLSPNRQEMEFTNLDTLAKAVFGEEAANAVGAAKKFYEDMVATILRVHLQDAFLPLPAERIAVGEKWQSPTEWALQGLCSIKADREFTRQSTERIDGRELDVVTWSSKITMKALDNTEGVLPFTLKELKERAKPTYTGKAFIDSARKRLVRTEASQTHDLDMLMLIQGNEVRSQGKGSDEFEVRFHTANPDAN